MSDPDPLADLIALGREQKAAVLQQCGTRSVLQVAELLGVTPETVDDLRTAGKLIAVQGSDEFVYRQSSSRRGLWCKGYLSYSTHWSRHLGLLSRS
jgi:hypothetical protein